MTLQVKYNHEALQDRVTRDPTFFRNLEVLDVYYSERAIPPGFYMKLSKRTAKLLTSAKLIPNNIERDKAEAETINVGQWEHCYDLPAEVHVMSTEETTQ